MISILGLAISGSAIWMFWALLPRQGTPHRLATLPVLESILPLTIVGGLAIGVAMAIAGAI
jgi:hypothetical protein